MSVHKRGNKWIFRKRVTLPDGTVKNIQRTFDSKKEAQLQEQLFTLEKKYDEAIKNLTINSCYDLFEKLKADEFNDSKVKSYTTYNYRKLFDKHIKLIFGNKHPNMITRQDIENWKIELNKLGLSWAYKTKIFTTYKSLFQFIRNRFYISNDPFLGVEGFSKRITTTDKSAIEPIQFWTHEEFLRFDSVSYDKSPIECYKLLFELAYYTGCRRGELLCLTWEDVNWDKQTISITKSLSNTPYNELKNRLGDNVTWRDKVNTPKNNPSFREIDISGFLIERLKSHYELCKQYDNFSDKCLILGMYQPLARTSITRYMNKFIKEAGIKKIKVHDLRHSHASLLVEHGFTLFEIAKRLGHGSIKETERTYAHLYPDAQKRMSTSMTLERVKLTQK